MLDEDVAEYCVCEMPLGEHGENLAKDFSTFAYPYVRGIHQPIPGRGASGFASGGTFVTQPGGAGGGGGASTAISAIVGAQAFQKRVAAGVSTRSEPPVPLKDEDNDQPARDWDSEFQALVNKLHQLHSAKSSSASATANKSERQAPPSSGRRSKNREGEAGTDTPRSRAGGVDGSVEKKLRDDTSTEKGKEQQQRAQSKGTTNRRVLHRKRVAGGRPADAAAREEQRVKQQLEKLLSEFDETACEVVELILQEREKERKQQSVRPVSHHHTPQLFVHRNIFYHMFTEAQYSQFHGSVEGAYKAVSAEVRALRSLLMKDLPSGGATEGQSRTTKAEAERKISLSSSTDAPPSGGHGHGHGQPQPPSTPGQGTQAFPWQVQAATVPPYTVRVPLCTVLSWCGFRIFASAVVVNLAGEAGRIYGPRSDNESFVLPHERHVQFPVLRQLAQHFHLASNVYVNEEHRTVDEKMKRTRASFDRFDYRRRLVTPTAFGSPEWSLIGLHNSPYIVAGSAEQIDSPTSPGDPRGSLDNSVSFAASSYEAHTLVQGINDSGTTGSRGGEPSTTTEKRGIPSIDPFSPLYIFNAATLLPLLDPAGVSPLRSLTGGGAGGSRAVVPVPPQPDFLRSPPARHHGHHREGGTLTSGTQRYHHPPQRRFLMEAVRNYPDTIPTNAFTVLSKPEENNIAARATRWVAVDCVERVALQLRNWPDDEPFNGAALKEVMHSHGVNLCFLGNLYRCLTEEKTKLKAHVDQEAQRLFSEEGDQTQPQQQQQQQTTPPKKEKEKAHPTTAGGAEGTPYVPALNVQAILSAKPSANTNPSSSTCNCVGEPSPTKESSSVVCTPLNAGTEDSPASAVVTSARRLTESTRSVAVGPNLPVTPRVPTLPPSPVPAGSLPHPAAKRLPLHEIAEVIRIEMVARSFRTVMFEALRCVIPGSKTAMAIQHFAAQQGGSTPRQGGGDTDVAKLALSDSDLDIPSPRKGKGGTLVVSPPSKIQKLSRQLSALEAVGSPSVAEAQGQLAVTGSLTPRTLARADILSASPRYCEEDTTGSWKNKTAGDLAQEKTVSLLNRLSTSGRGSQVFWDAVMAPELWSRYQNLGRSDLFQELPLQPLRKRIAELCGIVFRAAPEANPLPSVLTAEDVLALVPISKSVFAKAHVVPTKPMKLSQPDSHHKLKCVAAHDFPLAEAELLKKMGELEATGRATPGSAQSIAGTPSSLGEERSLDSELQRWRQNTLMVLADLEALYCYAGGTYSSDLVLTRAKIRALQVKKLLEELQWHWAKRSVDGPTFIPCRECSILINASQLGQHRCEKVLGTTSGGTLASIGEGTGAAIPPHPTATCTTVTGAPSSGRRSALYIDRGVHPSGLGDASLPDSCITVSSCAGGSKPGFARLGIHTNKAWMPKTAQVEKEWIQVEFPGKRTVTAVATAGDDAGHFTKYYRLEYSNNGTKWTLYRGRYRHWETAMPKKPAPSYTIPGSGGGGGTVQDDTGSGDGDLGRKGSVVRSSGLDMNVDDLFGDVTQPPTSGRNRRVSLSVGQKEKLLSKIRLQEDMGERQEGGALAWRGCALAEELTVGRLGVVGEVPVLDPNESPRDVALKTGPPEMEEREFIIPSVMAGNSEPHCVGFNELLSPFEARYIRLTLGSDADMKANETALKLEVYCRDLHGSLPARHTRWSELVPSHSIDWFGFSEGGSASRFTFARQELAILRRMDELEQRLQKVDRQKVRIELGELQSQWLALLKQWGTERLGDFTFLNKQYAQTGSQSPNALERIGSPPGKRKQQTTRQIQPVSLTSW